jgi:hypothetical protein
MFCQGGTRRTILLNGSLVLVRSVLSLDHDLPCLYVNCATTEKIATPTPDGGFLRDEAFCCNLGGFEYNCPWLVCSHPDQWDDRPEPSRARP